MAAKNMWQNNQVSGLEKWDCSGCYMQSLRIINSPSRICPFAQWLLLLTVLLLQTVRQGIYIENLILRTIPKETESIYLQKIYDRQRFVSGDAVVVVTLFQRQLVPISRFDTGQKRRVMTKRSMASKRGDTSSVSPYRRSLLVFSRPEFVTEISLVAIFFCLIIKGCVMGKVPGGNDDVCSLANNTVHVLMGDLFTHSIS